MNQFARRSVPRVKFSTLYTTDTGKDGALCISIKATLSDGVSVGQADYLFVTNQVMLHDKSSV